MPILFEKDIEIAAKILKQGGVLVFPTETVYGIGVVYDSEDSFNKLVSIKRRPPNKPFALMCSSSKEASVYIIANNKINALMDKFLPGQITFLVRAKDDLPHWVTLGTNIIGIRVPESDYVCDLISRVGKPCLVTSANISGEPPALTYEEAINYIGDKVDLVIKDYGYTAAGRASTVVGFKNDEAVIYRQGDVII